MITVKICPNCGSEDVYMVAGGIIGSWMCKKCGYTGSVFEKEIIEGDMQRGKIKEDKKKKKGKEMKR